MFLVGLGSTGLSDPDEGRNAEVAREMLARGDWITPHINDAVYLDKPPLFFWAVGASLALFGVDEQAARLPSALAAIAGIALVVAFARRHLGPWAGFASAAILALSPLYVVFGRLVIFDMGLLVCTTAAVMAAYESLESERPGRLMPAFVFAAAGLGTITKGPVALVVPLLVAVAWALVCGAPGRLARLRWGQGIVVYLAVVTPWVVAVEMRHPGFLNYALLGENLSRMTANPYDTARPFHFYARVLLPGLFPWIVLVAAGAAGPLVRRLRGRAAGAGAAGAADGGPGERNAARTVRFLWVWLAVLVVFFSVITSKRPSYILPCAVPVAMLAAWIIERAARGAAGAAADRTAGAVLAAAVCVLAATGLLLAPSVLRSTALESPADDRLAAHAHLFPITAAGLLVAATAIVLARRGARPGLFVAAAALPFLVMLPLARAGARHVEMLRSSRAVSRFLMERLHPGDRVVLYEEYRPGMNFYLRLPLYQITRAGRVFTSNYIEAHLDRFRADPSFRLLTTDAFRAALRDEQAATWVLAPRKEYRALELSAGLPLARVREAGGFGLFLPER
jgi:4-amino-4-deoxy-L-arabinose transferase-like glycosyltransferase